MLNLFAVVLVALALSRDASSQTFFTDSSVPSLAAGRSWESPVVTRPRQDRYFTVASSISKLALDLGKCRGSCSSNSVFSPLSLSSAMSLLLLGSGGSTYSQLRNALAYEQGVDDERIHQSFQLILDRLNGIDKLARDSLILSIANAVFAQTNLQLSPSYVDKARSYYRSEIRELDFSNNPSLSTFEINRWVSQKTNGKIQNILTSPVPVSTKVVLANAVYFNANWEEPFPATETNISEFFISESESVRVNMMSQVLQIPYFEDRDLGFRAIGLPYKGDDIGMFIILPTTGVGLSALNELEAKLTPDIVDSIIPNTDVKKVQVYLPRFRIEQRLFLRGALSGLGASDLFSPSANLTRMMHVRGVGLDEVIHQTVIEVTESGTEAASSTVPMLIRDFPQKVFRVNQPFIFFIQDISTGAKLFWGRVVRPESPRGFTSG